MDNPPPPVAILTGSDLTALAVAAALEPADIPTSRINRWPDNLSHHILIIDDLALGQLPVQLDHQQPARILIASACDPATVHRLITRGFSGYLYLGDSLIEHLPQAVRTVATGGTVLSSTAASALARFEHYTTHIQPRLTAYQLRVLSLTARHWSAKRIAAHQGRSLTAIYQVQRLLRHLFAAETNGQLVSRATQLGLIAPKSVYANVK